MEHPRPCASSPGTVVWDARAPVRWAAGIAGLLVLAQVGVLLLRHGLDHDVALGFIPLFDLNRENNLPSD